MKYINLADIRTNGGTQSRAQIDRETVADYAEQIEAGAVFPPVIVYYDGAAYWLADGFHRYEAFARINAHEIPAEVRQGSQRDAILHSVGANATHGLKRSNDDKRRAVMVLLNDPEWSKWSDREIARQCGVTHPFVARQRPKVTGNVTSDESRTYTNKHGTEATMDTSRIGKAAADAAAPVADQKAKPNGLSGLTREGLEDEVLGLRSENDELRAKLEKLESENAALKEQVADLSKGDLGAIISRQKSAINALKFERDNANEAARKADYRVKKAEQRVEELQNVGIIL